MKKQLIGVLIISSFLFGCTISTKKADNSSSAVSVDFGDIKIYQASEIITDYSFIKLETNDNVLIGDISQLEIRNDKIYILDTYATRSLFVFSMDGKFLTSIEGLGKGPGEFITPHSFQIDDDGHIFIYDMFQRLLLKYNSDNLNFVEKIVIPTRSPLSFFKVPEKDEFIYYCIPNIGENIYDKQLIIADKSGIVKHELWDTPVTSKLNHGNPANLYYFDNHINFYPHFSNKVFSIKNDSLQCRYELFWGNNKIAEEAIFNRGSGSNAIFQELMKGEKDWIRLIYLYENQKYLLAKYYIKSDFYVGIYNKQDAQSIHYKHSEIKDDIGLGETHPLPVGVYNHQLVGFIDPQEMNEAMVKDMKLKNVIHNFNKMDNPILVLYTLKDEK